MKAQLKFSGKFKVGQIIKAFDFKPSPDRQECYIIGKIIDAESHEHGFASYKVEIIRHEMGTIDKETGDEAWIPHQVSFLEFDDRISIYNG